MNKVLNKLLNVLISFSNFRRRYLQNNKIIFIKDNRERLFLFGRKFFKCSFRGYNNTIKIEFPINKNILKKVKIKIVGDNKNVFIGSNSGGKFFILMTDDACCCSIGKNTKANGCLIMTAGQNIRIWDNCMFAQGIEIISDGYSIFDINSKEILNKPKHDLIVGNNVWLCNNVTLIKNTIIPNGCIVANGAIVTKEFTEENCVIGGVPAKIIKTGCTWIDTLPSFYNKNIFL